MKASLQDQKILLEIAGLDLELARNSSEQKKLLDSDQVEIARQVLLAASDDLIDKRNRVGELELELKKAESDLELVENRIAKDKESLAKTSSSKDAQGIERELESLRKRKSELEDYELSVLELMETARGDLSEATTRKAEAEKGLEQLSDTTRMAARSLDEQLLQLKASHEKLVSSLDPDLATLYQKKAGRGIAIGRLLGRDCGACRLSITASNLDEITSLPVDEIAECPNCQALLVRS